MTHTTLLKHDWVVIFESPSFTAYQLLDKIAIIWDSGASAVYDAR